MARLVSTPRQPPSQDHRAQDHQPDYRRQHFARGCDAGQENLGAVSSNGLREPMAWKWDQFFLRSGCA
jgi:hypothetical protein